MTVIPPELESYGYVTARVIRVVGDTVNDLDEYPEAVGASGTITFTPVVSQQKTSDYSALVMHESIVCTLGDGGEMYGPSARPGVWLITGAYTVKIDVPGSSWSSFTIDVKSTHTALSPLDLAAALPYIPPPTTTPVTMLLPPGGQPGQFPTPTVPNSTTLEWMTPVDSGGGGNVDVVQVATGNEVRPSTSTVFWIGGTVEPANMQVGDVWFSMGTPAPAPVAPTITTASLNSMTQGGVFSQSLVASGTTPITWSVTAGTLPAGLTLSSAGVLSGTPSGSGAYDFTVTATNSAGSDTQQYTGTISEVPAEVSTFNVFGSGAHPYEHTMFSDGGGNLKVAQFFYALGQSAMVHKVRLWVPELPANPGDLTMWAFAGDMGPDGNIIPVTWGDIPALEGIGQLVVIPQANVVQGWNEVTLPTPFQVNPVSLAANSTDVFIIAGYHFGTGSHYSYCSDAVMPGGSAIQSPTASWLYFAEGGLPGGNRAANNTGGNMWTQVSYGLDVGVTAA